MYGIFKYTVNLTSPSYDAINKGGAKLWAKASGNILKEKSFQDDQKHCVYYIFLLSNIRPKNFLKENTFEDLESAELAFELSEF